MQMVKYIDLQDAFGNNFNTSLLGNQPKSLPRMMLGSSFQLVLCHLDGGKILLAEISGMLLVLDSVELIDEAESRR